MTAVLLQLFGFDSQASPPMQAVRDLNGKVQFREKHGPLTSIDQLNEIGLKATCTFFCKSCVGLVTKAIEDVSPRLGDDLYSFCVLSPKLPLCTSFLSVIVAVASLHAIN